MVAGIAITSVTSGSNLRPIEESNDNRSSHEHNMQVSDNQPSASPPHVSPDNQQPITSPHVSHTASPFLESGGPDRVHHQ